MRKILAPVVTLLVFVSLLTLPVFAQDNHTAREEKEGKIIWDKLQAKQITCDKLSDEDFERLGEYYMGQMMGDSHESMNMMMERMMGEDGEEQMHVVMGKRLSGCDTSAQFPQNGAGFMPMMFAMGGRGGGSPMMGTGWANMMAGWGGYSLLASLFWIVLLVDLILLGVWLWKRITKK
ncbi:hypothetical protein HYT33_02345 [Candidatus Roizmanbacteria bacterium]|nr:hypothetical protein [Candidatus Roizmanbacteria bacterium]